MAAIPTELFFATAVELNQRLARKEFTAVELARAFGDRIESLGPRQGTLALSLKPDSYHKARDVDRELKRGRTRGPLQGVPYSVQDLLSVARLPTTWGARPFASQVFDTNAAVVDKLSKTGAVLSAKLTAPELGGAGRHTAVETSAVVAAVAAGLTPYALGLETAGSFLLPAGVDRLTVLCPTYGLVSRFGAMPLAWTLDRIAAIARSAEDCGHILHAIAGGDDRDSGSSGKSFHFALQYEKPVSAMRIGFLPSQALQSPLDLLKQAGATLVEVQWPNFPYQAVARTILAAESSTTFADLVSSGAVDQLSDRRQIEGLRAGLEITATQYLTAMRVRRLIHTALNELLAPLDFLVTPGQAATDGGISTAGRPGGLPAHISACDLAGLPAIAIPGPPADGHPTSIYLIAKAQCENTLLQASLYLQAHSDWHRQKPPA